MRAILFVDDHEVLARLSCEILEMQGYRAVSAYNGEDALRKFDQEDFDILVTDFRMEGMNGVELARKVHERHPQVPVIIVTGYSPIDGGNDVAAWMQKEDLFPALVEKIKSLLDEPPADFKIIFDSSLSPQQVKATLQVLANFYRDCGGLGFEVDWEFAYANSREAVLA